MEYSKHLDSCIQILKGMRGDQSNELGSRQQRALGREIQKLKRLAKQQHVDPDELYRIVDEVAKTVSAILDCTQPK
jgi:hypothetical protein